MNKEILNTIILATAFLALFGTAELLYHYAKLKAEVTRKIVHVFTGVLTLLFPVMFSSHWSVLFLCASFAAILLASLHFKLLPSINAIDRKSAGSLCYPLAVYLCFLVYSLDSEKIYRITFLFYDPILILAICDPLAAFVGRRSQWGRYKVRGSNKTLAGSMAFFIAATVITFILLIPVSNKLFYFDVFHGIIISMIIGAITAATEAITGKGYDNLTIPLVVYPSLFICVYINMLI